MDDKGLSGKEKEGNMPTCTTKENIKVNIKVKLFKIHQSYIKTNMFKYYDLSLTKSRLLVVLQQEML